MLMENHGISWEQTQQNWCLFQLRSNRSKQRNCQLWIESLQQARNVFNFVNFWSFSIILYSTILRQFYRQLCFSIWTLITSIMYTVIIGSSAKWGSRQIWSIGAAKTWKRKVWKWQGCQKKTVVKKYQQAFHNTNTFVAINDCSRIYFRIEDISEIVCSSNLSLRCFRFFWRTKKGLVSSNSGVGCWRLIAGRKFELYFGASFWKTYCFLCSVSIIFTLNPFFFARKSSSSVVWLHCLVFVLFSCMAVWRRMLIGIS